MFNLKAAVVAGSLAAACVFVALPATAQDGDDWAFSAYNASLATIRQINMRQVNGTRWSTSFLRNTLAPHAEVALRFKPEDTECEYFVRVTWTNGYYVEDTVNFCDMTYLMVDADNIWTTND